MQSIQRASISAAMIWAAALAWGGDSAEPIVAKPLAPRPAAQEKTLFVPVAPEASGVRTENRYADPKMWGALYQEFLFGALGTGVAIGDYDNDGRPDLFIVSKTESCHLFRNLGDYKFEDVTDKAQVGDSGDAAAVWKQGVSFADVNNDGWLDIYVCRFNAPNLLYINQGDGTFKEMGHAYGLDIRDSSGMAAFCDYDRDGWLDVYIATNLLDSAKHPKGQRGYLLHNDRNGTFSAVTDRAGMTGETACHSATWWDYDNDGWPDLYIANDYGTPDKLYHNNRDGSFTNVLDQVLPHTSFSSMGSDIGDVNNDGLIDFLVADMAFTTHQYDQRGPADERGKTEDTPLNSPIAPKYHRNALLLNTGLDRCMEAAYLAGFAATDWTWAVRFEDLDNDGRLDLFVTNGMNKEENTDLNNRMIAAETTSERIRLMRDSPAIPQEHLAFRNLGDLRFENVGSRWGLNQKGISFGAAFGDLTGSGNLDLLYANYHAGATLLKNTCNSGHRIVVNLKGTVSNRFGVGATVRIETASGPQVRQLVLARGYMSTSEPMLHFGLGGDEVIKQMVVSWPSGHVQTFEQLAVDRRYIITEPSTPASPIRAKQDRPTQFTEVSRALNLSWTAREEPVDEVYQQQLIPFRLNRRGPGLAVGTTVDDSTDDIVIGGTTLDPIRLLRATKPPSFTKIETAGLGGSSSPNDGPLLLFDANGDGKNDLIVTKGGNALPAGAAEYQPRLYLNDGHGNFHPAPSDLLPALPINAGAIAAADFDHSGRLSLFVGGRVETGQYPFPPQSALLVNRGGRFEDATEALAPALARIGMVTSALWSDMDGDGWPDLLLTLEWGRVTCFRNIQGRRFEDWTEKAGFAAAGTGWWNSIAAADFNGDGRLDYVVGNLGLNTQYHASPEFPALLFSGDFDGNGATQLMEAYYENGILFPWRTRRDLGAAIPSIRKRFPRNDLYAKATLAEVLGPDKLAEAQRFAATEFRSGVFLSQGDGNFHFEPLPNLAQISPIQGLAVGDFDGDGFADVIAVQNSHAPIAAVGRFDGGLGLFLRGDGHGHFVPVAPRDSGLLVPGDAKALAVIDLDGDGWPDVLVSRNNGPTLAFRNAGVAGRHSLQVRLHGLSGNPNAIGARVSLELADGSIRTTEVAAGSGYYSQSTGNCFFGFATENPPSRVRVGWPSGATVEQKVPAGSTAISIVPLQN